MTIERARCPTCTHWLHFGTIDGLAVEYCAHCKTELYVQRRDPPPEKIPLREAYQRAPGTKGKQPGETSRFPRGPIYRLGTR